MLRLVVIRCWLRSHVPASLGPEPRVHQQHRGRRHLPRRRRAPPHRHMGHQGRRTPHPRPRPLQSARQWNNSLFQVHGTTIIQINNYNNLVCVSPRKGLRGWGQSDQGADIKNNQTTKQLNNYIWNNRKQVKFCFYLPIGSNKFFKLFSCLLVFKIRSLKYFNWVKWCSV